MGCAQSRIDNEESVARCKERKILMKEAVVARNAFAAAHSGYAISLKNTGAALSDYGHGEAEVPLPHPDQIPPPLHSTPQPPPPPPPLDSTPQPPPPPPPLDSTPQPPPPPPSMMDGLPPPPPLPNFSPSPVPIKRTVSMPAMPVKSRKEFDASLAIEEEEEEEEDDEVEEHHEGNDVNDNSKQDLRKVSRGSNREEITPPRTPESNNVGHHHPPPMPEAKNVAWDYFFMVDDSMPGPSLGLDDDINEAANTNVNGLENNASDVRFSGHEENNVSDVGFGGHDGVDSEIDPKTEIEPKTPERPEKAVEVDIDKGKQPVHIEHSKTAPADLRRMVKAVSSVNLMEVLNEIDDHFLKASECAQEVSKMLEATRLHYHSNFADNRGHIDHSERVMRVITWNRSFRGTMNGENPKSVLDSEDYETHATILDKLLAWEKKLYDEVKQGELMKIEYKRKLASLNKQKKHGASAESLEKTKAAVSHLHTRYIVDMQSMDSTVSEVNRIRDEQLYPKLFTLVEGMANMWERMCIHHDNQLKIVDKLKALDIAFASKETTKHHHEQTIQLHNVVQEWHSQFDKLVTHHKQYIRALNNWLKLNLIPIESSLKEKVSSPPRPQNPPIQTLLRTWHDYLEKLPDEVAKSAIASFAAVIKTIIIHQDEEMKLKEKCEETRKEYLRKNQAFEEWYHKNKQRRDEIDAERGEDANTKDIVSDRQFVVESLKKRLEEEVGAHEKHCIQVREKSLGSLKLRLPELFRAMSDYSHACSDAYEKLRAVIHSQKPSSDPS